MSGHTKGKLTFRGKDRDRDAVLDMDGEYFAVITFPMKKQTKSIKANAERLVLCWNSHDALLEVCEAMLDCLPAYYSSYASIIKQAKAAITVAT